MLLTGGPKTFPIFSFLFGGFNTASWPRLLVALPYFAVGAAVVARARALGLGRELPTDWFLESVSP